MGRRAPCVVTDQDAIRRLESLVEALPGNARVLLHLQDGSLCEGLISVRPTLQIFRDPHGVEGTNGEVEIERRDAAEGHCRIWLEQIARVEHLDAGMASEN
ncbi:MAG: DUF3247 family protein [Rhodanobacter sp.]